MLYAGRTGLFDAMPAAWNNMSPDMRTQVFNVIQDFYDEALQSDEEPWSVKNIWKLQSNTKYTGLLPLCARPPISVTQSRRST